MSCERRCDFLKRIGELGVVVAEMLRTMDIDILIYLVLIATHVVVLAIGWNLGKIHSQPQPDANVPDSVDGRAERPDAAQPANHPGKALN
jgi:hypothetical protein